MRYDLTEFEWSVIEPLLPMDRRGPIRKNNRHILDSMFYVLRAGSPHRALAAAVATQSAAECLLASSLSTTRLSTETAAESWLHPPSNGLRALDLRSNRLPRRAQLA